MRWMRTPGLQLASGEPTGPGILVDISNREAGLHGMAWWQRRKQNTGAGEGIGREVWQGCLERLLVLSDTPS